MFSVKKNVLQTVALIKAYNIKHIVISPGSRNAPLIQTFSEDDFFQCHVIVDERNAAFYALGIIQYTQEPVVICCTSGSALLNYAPAVSEAFYQQLPLVVVSADRSPEWIGQMDGQTIPQVGVFGTMAKKSVNLPEIKNDTDEWYCNRLINEALIACTADSSGPVQINVPLSEPLFDYSESFLPKVRKIEYYKPIKTVDINRFVSQWNSLGKRLIIVGQMFYNPQLIEILEQLVEKCDCIVFTEHLSNCASPLFINNHDALLSALDEGSKGTFAPELVITFGGHIVSKRLKHFLRQNKPQNHWHLSESGEVVDLFQSLTDLVEVDAISFLTDLFTNVNSEIDKPFSSKWKSLSDKISEPTSNIPFSDILVTGAFLKNLPEKSDLHLANSSVVRNAQLYSLDKSVRVFCDRGVNGIESCLPSAVGFAAVSDKPVYLLIGDLSFFYGVGALWNISHIKNLRIFLINNSGGGIFSLLPGLDKASSLKEYVIAEHQSSAKDWALAAGLTYLSASNNHQLEENMELFITSDCQQSILFEVFTDTDISKEVSQEYYSKLKTL